MYRKALACLPLGFERSWPSRLVSPAASLSHAPSSSESMSLLGGSKGSRQIGSPSSERGVQTLTSADFDHSACLLGSDFESSSGGMASLARSPWTSMIIEGMPAIAHSSSIALAITVLPEPLEPSMPTCLSMCSPLKPVTGASPSSIPSGTRRVPRFKVSTGEKDGGPDITVP